MKTITLILIFSVVFALPDSNAQQLMIAALFSLMMVVRAGGVW